MTVYITEHVGARPDIQTARQAAVAAYSMGSSTTAGSGVSTGGVFPQTGTKYIRVTADGSGASGGMLLCLNSTSTSLALTSTNSYRISANGPGELFSVSTAFRIQAAST
jgi:hypothetical protein